MRQTRQPPTPQQLTSSGTSHPPALDRITLPSHQQQQQPQLHPTGMNSPPPITSRANRRRALSLDSPSTPLLGSIAQRRTDKIARDEAALRDQQLHAVSRQKCWAIYIVLASLYLGIVGVVYMGRRPGAFVPALPDMAPGQTKPGEFNPFTAWEHLEAITTVPHPFNSRANTDITRQYIRDQFRTLQAEAIALGRRNVRYDDGLETSPYTRLHKSKQQNRMEESGETEPREEEELQPEMLDVFQSDNMVMWVGGVAQSMEGNVPVRIEIDVDQESQTALLVGTHYDSVATTYGATDAGGGVAVTLALIRHFIHHPVQHTLIFNLNNAEELGLFGAAAFMGATPNSAFSEETGTGHPWKKHVRAFVNLEGAGAGGPSLLFRATNSDIVRHYAENAPFPHASVFANDIFGFGAVESETDYFIYNRHGLPGLDIAFYQQRSMYHSSTDWLPIESLYHMGSNTQATIIGLCNSPYLDSLRLPSDPNNNDLSPISPRLWLTGKSIFYDLLGKQMFFAELWTSLLANALVLGLGLPVLAYTLINVGRALRIRRDHNSRTSAASLAAEQNPTHSLRSVLDSSSMSAMGYSDDGYSAIPTTPRVSTSSSRPHGRYPDPAESLRYIQPRKAVIARTTALVALIVILDVTAVVAASKWQLQINPLVRNAHAWVVLLGLASVLLFINTLVVYLATSVESYIYGPVPIMRGATQWTLAISVWWWIVVLLIGTGLAGWFGVGLFYGTTVLAASAGAASLIQIAMGLLGPVEGMDSSKFGWILVLAAGLLVPGVVVLDLLVVVVYLTGQSLLTNDTGAIYIVYGLLLIPVLLPTIPVISRGRNFKVALAWELLVAAAILWWLSRAESFTATEPASLYFLQQYNQTARTSTVSLFSDGGPGMLERMLQDLPINGSEGPSGECHSRGNSGPDDMMRRVCEYTPVRQIFDDKEDGLGPVHADWITGPVRGQDGWVQGRLQVYALESRQCSVYVAETSPGYKTQIWMEQDEKHGSGSGSGKNQAEAEDKLNNRAKRLNVYVREWNRAWTVVVRVQDPKSSAPETESSRKTVPMKVVCAYDEWTSEQGYASVYNEIRTHIPSWMRMQSLGGAGLFRVGVDLQL